MLQYIHLTIKHRELFAEHEKLKKDIAIYFESQNKFLNLAETVDQKKVLKNYRKAEASIKEKVKVK